MSKYKTKMQSQARFCAFLLNEINMEFGANGMDEVLHLVDKQTLINLYVSIRAAETSSGHTVNFEKEDLK